jgi:adenylyltransferase/sulfurtransferase
MTSLSPEQLERYKRHLYLDEVGPAGQEQLLQARVLLIGAGGLGCPAALYLAAAGVGTLGMADFDTVDASNLQRQVLYGTADVGRPKVEVARERLAQLNPDVNVIAHEERLDASNAERILREYDVILDGTDTFPSRYLTNDVCVWLGRPLVYGSVMRFEGQVSVFDAKKGPCYRCLFPEPPPPELAPNCAEAGVLGVLPGTIGLLQATEVVKLLLGRGEPLIGRLLTYDALASQFKQFRLPKDPECAVCGANATITEPIDYEEFCASSAGASTEGDSQVIEDITPAEVHARLEAKEDILLLDVREPFEADMARIEGATLLPLGQLEGSLGELEAWRTRPIVVQCHHGPRSRAACQVLLSAGFERVQNLLGGIDAWSLEVDSSIPRY